MRRAGGTFGVQVRNFERRLILDALERAKGNTAKAARMLGIARNTMLAKRDAAEQEDPIADDGDDPALAFAILRRPFPKSFQVQACWTREAIAESLGDARLVALILDYDRAYTMANHATVNRDQRHRAQLDSAMRDPSLDTIPTDTEGVGRVLSSSHGAMSVVMPGPNSRLLSPAMRAKVEYAS